VVYPPLWKMWKSVGMILPNIWKKSKCSKPPTSHICTRVQTCLLEPQYTCVIHVSHSTECRNMSTCWFCIYMSHWVWVSFGSQNWMAGKGDSVGMTSQFPVLACHMDAMHPSIPMASFHQFWWLVGAFIGQNDPKWVFFWLTKSRFQPWEFDVSQHLETKPFHQGPVKFGRTWKIALSLGHSQDLTYPWDPKIRGTHCYPSFHYPNLNWLQDLQISGLLILDHCH
jgi:hypothetical protein